MIPVPRSATADVMPGTPEGASYVVRAVFKCCCTAEEQIFGYGAAAGSFDCLTCRGLAAGVVVCRHPESRKIGTKRNNITEAAHVGHWYSPSH